MNLRPYQSAGVVVVVEGDGSRRRMVCMACSGLKTNGWGGDPCTACMADANGNEVVLPQEYEPEPPRKKWPGLKGLPL